MTIRDHGFHPLRIARIVPETADAVSLVLDVPPHLRSSFAYRAGQFCTFRATIGGETVLRCYSMSSSPDVDDELAVTVKRVPDGLMSNWMLDELQVGDVIDVTLPAGVFCLPEDGGSSADSAGDLVAYCGGSGITPVFSLAKSALATTDRRVRLLYANRDRDSVIFGDALDALAAAHPDRLEVMHHHDADGGFLDEARVAAFAAGAGRSPSEADHYICGPGPFMDLVEVVLVSAGVTPDRVHIERFTPAELLDPADEDSAPDGIRVTIELDGRVESTDHHPGTTLLQTARQVGLSAPSSCEAGSCATCMGRLVEGRVEMFVNNALTDDEVADGWVLTCQSVPTTPTVHVVYGFEED